MKRTPNTDYPLPAEFAGRVSWFRQQLSGWYEQHGRSYPWRDPARTTYEILVAEILLQRTTASRVSAAFPAFVKLYPSWAALVEAEIGTLEDVLHPLGMWQRKASALVGLACSMVGRAGVAPNTRFELEKLEGVGQYIASAVLVAIYSQPEPLMDVNMARVLERFFGPRKLADIRYDPYLQTLARRVVAGPDPLETNWAILDFGALVCTSRQPRCSQCPLVQKCAFSKKSSLQAVTASKERADALGSAAAAPDKQVKT